MQMSATIVLFVPGGLCFADALYRRCLSDDDADGSLSEGRFIGFYATRDEMNEVVSRCLPHRQLWVSNLCKVAMQWIEVSSDYKAQNSAVLTTGQTGHWPGPELQGPRAAGSGNFLLLNFAVKILIDFMALMWL